MKPDVRAIPLQTHGRKNAIPYHFTQCIGLWGLFILVLVAPCGNAADGDVDPGFNPFANNTVQSIAVQPDGKIVIVGDFLNVAGVERNRIARLNNNGALDAFDLGDFSPVDATIYTTTVQADGKIVIGGDFFPGIARLDADGTLDSFYGGGVFGYVRSASMQTDEKLIIGGEFLSTGDETYYTIARLNANGTLDTAFNPDVSGYVHNTIVQADGKIIIAGYFTTVGGVTRNNIARLNPNGTLDLSFNSSVYGPYVSVGSLALQADGRIVIGGSFTNVGGLTRNNIARLNPDGTLDTAFNPNANNSVFTTTLQADGRIVIGGFFTNVGGIARNCIARLNADGTLDSAFNPNLNNAVFSATPQSDGKIVIGGAFSTVGGVARNSIARLLNGNATNLLTVPSSNRVQWLRGGTAPEAIHVTFELTTDTINWTPLGNGSRINGGWELTGLSLPATGLIRARARIVSNSGSSGLVEQRVSFGSPEIELQQAGTNLVDGIANISFGNTFLGSSSPPKTFFILNSSIADLVLTNITKDGLHPGEFTVGPLGSTNLSVGSFTAFSVTFSPAALGPRSAAIHIASNDSDENPFDIVLTGMGMPPPEIAVEQPVGFGLVDGVSSIGFGIASVGSTNAARTFSITNMGAGDLILTNITKNGLHPGDFIVGTLGATTLPSGASTTFNVFFAPTASGNRSAAIHIFNNDGNENPFDITLTGVGSFALPDILTTPANKELQFSATDLKTNDFAEPFGSDLQIVSLAITSTQSGILSFVPDGKPLWTNRYSRITTFSTSDDRARKVATDASGNTYVAGVSSADTVPNASYVVVKYAQNGSAVWTNTFDSGGAYADTVALAVDASGNIVLAGSAFASGGTSDYLTMKFSPNGVLLWTNRYNGPANDEDFPASVAVDAAGNVLVTGYSYGLTSGDVATIKYFANGTPAWTNRYNGPADGYDEPSAITLDPNGHVLVTGLSEGLGNDGGVIIKYFSNGTPAWTNRFGASGDFSTSAPYGLAVDTGGNAYVTAEPSGVQWAYLTLKYLASGALAWTNRYAPSGADETVPVAIGVDESGNVYVTGRSTPPGGSSDFVTLKYLPSGAPAWTNRYSEGVDFPTALVLDREGHVHVGGYSGLASGSGGLPAETHYVTIKYRPNGTAIYTNRFGYNDGFDDLAQGLAVDRGGNVFVTGFSEENLGTPDADFVSIKYGGPFEATYTPPLNFTGTDSFTYVVQNAAGQYATGTVSVIVTGGPPIMTSQPQSGLVSVGSNLTLSATAIGLGTLHYQWSFNHAALTGATNSSLAITNAQLIHAGDYRVMVTNSFGSVTSSVASLSVYDASFPGFTISNVYPVAAAVQADGRILIGGGFIWAGRTNIVRLLSNGAIDSSFNAGADGFVNCLAIQDDGKIVVGGGFLTLNGQARTNIGRLNNDGTLDLSFNPPGLPAPKCLAVQPDGKILVAGRFFTGFETRGFIRRLNTNGTWDAQFDAEGVTNGSIESIALQADGKIVVVGDFLRLNGQPRGSVGRLNADGSIDPSFGPYVNGDVYSTAIQADGKIFIGGTFSLVAGVPRNGLALLNPDGTVDSSFNPGVLGFDSEVILPQADGRILFGGSGGSGRLNREGTLHTAFAPSVVPVGIDAIGNTLVVDDNGFSKLPGGGITIQRLEIDSSGTTARWSRAGSGPEVQQVRFEKSFDGVNFTAIGIGIRSNGVWQLTGLSLPALDSNLVIRASGRTVSGSHNGSSGVNEWIEAPVRTGIPVLGNPTIGSHLVEIDEGVFETEQFFQFTLVNPGDAYLYLVTSTNLSLPLASWAVAAELDARGTTDRVFQAYFYFTTNDTPRFFRMLYQR